MSWILDKAENILNKIDQNAATALLPGAPNSPIHNPTAEVQPSLDVLQKSLSGSTQSLKAMTLSPKITKPSRGGSMGQRGGGLSGGSVKSEGSGFVVTDSMDEGKEQLQWQSSPRSSLAVAIDMGGDVAEARPEKSNSSFISIAGGGEQTQELAAFKIALSEISSERDELRQRLLALNHDMENVSLKQRAHELEQLAQRLNEERELAQQQLHDAQVASSAYVHSISELESNLAKIQQEFVEIAQKLQMQIKETEQQRHELHEYRVKAQRTLQAKDHLISELKASGGAGISSDTEAQRLLQLEYDTLRQEQMHAVTEQRSLALQMEEMRRDAFAIEQEHGKMLTGLYATEETLRKELRSARESALAYESEQRVLTQELQIVRQQLSNQMAQAATRLQDLQQQMQQVSRKTSAAGDVNESSSALGDYDTRFKALTQALVDKQSTVEHITAERNALRIQLEKVKDQLQQSIYSHSAAVHKAPRNALLSNSTDDVKAQFPLLMKANPFDNRVARRVKRAYSSLDSAGIRLGAFLRRYPLMRIFVLMYVALLHIWVMFVLFSYTPN